jgi:trans-2,3-dihydro-3-hydroxyanthranilate isomerase
MNSRKSYRYQVLDVFTQVSLEGNALAVFPDAGDLDGSTMQKIARELSLSETVFILPSRRADCLARFKIFTPRKELDFAGHPTLGTSYVLLKQGTVPAGTLSFSVEENVGPIPVSVDAGDVPMLWLRIPPVEDGPSVGRREAAAAIQVSADQLLEATPQILSAGNNPTLFIALKDKQSVDKAALNSAELAVLKKRHHPDPMCTFIFAPTREGAYSRMFAPDYGIAEDPATGSSTGPLAVYMMRNKFAPSASGSRFLSEQGTHMGRRSILHIKVHGAEGKDGIDVGGFVTPVIDAEIRL